MNQTLTFHNLFVLFLFCLFDLIFFSYISQFNVAITISFCLLALEPYAWWKLDLTEECIVTQFLLVPATAKIGKGFLA